MNKLIWKKRGRKIGFWFRGKNGEKGIERES